MFEFRQLTLLVMDESRMMARFQLDQWSGVSAMLELTVV